MSTARAAADYGFNVTVIEDAAATRDAEFDGMIVPADQVACRIHGSPKLRIWQGR